MKRNKNSEDGSEKKQKKQKIVYIDDGSTVSDMSGTFKKGRTPQTRASFKEQARTFFTAMKKMILPLLVTLIVLTAVYFIILAIAGGYQ